MATDQDRQGSLAGPAGKSISADSAALALISPNIPAGSPKSAREKTGSYWGGSCTNPEGFHPEIDPMASAAQFEANRRNATGSSAAEAADFAAFDPSLAFERHRRHQASLGRNLLRTVDTLRRLLKVEARPSADVDQPEPADEPSSPPPEAANEVDEQKNVTNKANLESTQESVEMEVTSNHGNCEDDEQSQSAAPQGGPSMDEIPVLSSTNEVLEENGRNGGVSHEGEGRGREHENTTNKANLESTQESAEMEVASNHRNCEDDEQSQSEEVTGGWFPGRNSG